MYSSRYTECLTESSQPALFFVSWLFLKFIRWFRNDLEWYVKLGSWDQLKLRLDQLASAVVTDKIVPIMNGNVEDDGDGFEMGPVREQPDAEARDSGYVTPGPGEAVGLGVASGGIEGDDGGDMQVDRTPRPMDPTDAAEAVRWDRPEWTASPHPSPRTNYAVPDRGYMGPTESVGSPEAIRRRPVGQGGRQMMPPGPSGQQAFYGGGEEMDRQLSGERQAEEAQEQVFDERVEPGPRRVEGGQRGNRGGHI